MRPTVWSHAVDGHANKDSTMRRDAHDDDHQHDDDDDDDDDDNNHDKHGARTEVASGAPSSAMGSALAAAARQPTAAEGAAASASRAPCGSAGDAVASASASAQWLLPDDAARLDRCRYIVIGGGGAKGVALCGALSALRRVYAATHGGSELLFRLQGTAGTSIGAAIALAACCCVKGGALQRFVTDPDMWTWAQFASDMDPVRFMRTRGLCTHRVLYRHIDRLMALLGLPSTTNFYTLHRLTGREFVCNAACIATDSVLYMSRTTTPYMPVRDALCMSMCVPGYIEPFLYNGHEYVDGGVFCNYIADVFPEGCTMGIAIEGAHRIAPAAAAATASPSCTADSLRSALFTGADGAGMNGFVWVATLFASMSARINAMHLERMSPERIRSTVQVHTPGCEGMMLSADRVQIRTLWHYGKFSVLWYFGRYAFVSWFIWRELVHQMGRIQRRAWRQQADEEREHHHQQHSALASASRERDAPQPVASSQSQRAMPCVRADNAAAASASAQPERRDPHSECATAAADAETPAQRRDASEPLDARDSPS